MGRVAEHKLSHRRDGSWVARKRIPADVQDDYERLYGVRWEARWHCDPVSATLARQKHREWLTEIEGRIATIRAERKAVGRPLTPQEARALAGEWYHWFTAKHGGSDRPAAHWDTLETVLFSDLSSAVNAALADGLNAPRGIDLLKEWDQDPEIRADMRPAVADYGETAQFLHAKHLVLDGPSRDMFLDNVVRDLFAALDLLKRQAHGDYSADTWAEQFPKFDRAGDPGITPWKLFERWVAEGGPEDSTVNRWRSVFKKLREDFKDGSAAALTPEQANDWAQGLINPTRSPGTVRGVWVRAARTVFNFAVEKRLLSRNPFDGIKIRVPKTQRHRDGKGFTTEEARTILTAAQAVPLVKRKMEAAKRWVPWLCAYTGARAGEITQLRGSDVSRQEGIHAIRITPEAGTVKTKQARTVPLHEHLIEQGFLKFVTTSGQGPLFYNESKEPAAARDATNPLKPRSVKTRERLGTWVRSLGVTDTEIRPNHAWRDTFKLIGHRSDISERILDSICGHAPVTVGRGYGLPTLRDKAGALEKFPRYDLSRPTGRGD